MRRALAGEARPAVGHGRPADGGARALGPRLGLGARQSATQACSSRLSCPPAVPASSRSSPAWRRSMPSARRRADADCRRCDSSGRTTFSIGDGQGAAAFWSRAPRRSRAAERLAVIGIGHQPRSPRTASIRAATYLAAHGLSLSPARGIGFLAEAMDGWLETWDDGAGFARVRAGLARARRAGRRAAYGPYRRRALGRALCRARRRRRAADRRDPTGASAQFTFGDVMIAAEPA